jgi:nucleotide-binding universal stress UspA family protein
MFRRILFATDLSEYAKKALDYIAGFPDAREVLLLYVLQAARSPHGGGEVVESFTERERSLLKEEKHHLESLNTDLKVTTMVKASSDIPGAIIETADEQEVSLIAVGARGNSVVEGILLGSVSTAILRRSRTNVLVLRHKLVEDMAGKRHELSCPVILARILCPTDFSSFSDRAISLVSTTKGTGEIILLNVVSHGETESEIKNAVEDAKERIEKIRGDLSVQGIKARSRVRIGNPASEIIEVADEEDVSLIWIGSQGKGWFKELLIGSTAYDVAMNARKPVIIIREAESKA